MRHLIKLFVGVALWTFFALPALAQDAFELANGNTRTGVLDSTGMRYTGSNYGVLVSHDSGDPDLFINAVTVTGGTTWDADIDMSTNLSYLGFTNGSFLQGSYTLGTAISNDISWNFDSLAQRGGEIASTVAPGIYDFDVQMVGGSSVNATDVLATFSMQIEVVDTITASATASTDPAAIGWGESTTASVTFNNLGTRNIVTTTWYVSGFGLNGPGAASGDLLTLDSFQGDWFNKTIAGGQSRTDQHSRWTSVAPNTPGTYSGDIGIIGGFYNGDVHQWRATDDVTVQVVPEPISMIGLCTGLGLILRRRRK